MWLRLAYLVVGKFTLHSAFCVCDHHFTVVVHPSWVSVDVVYTCGDLVEGVVLVVPG